MALFSNSIPCILCGKSLEERTSKNRKPYFVCDPCGMQLFIRRKLGIERLGQLKKSISQNSIFIKKPQKLLEIQRSIAEINGIKAEIEKIDRAVIIFYSEEESRIKKVLENRLEAALQKFEDLEAEKV
jgi:DNA-directed RNA polymerase subunit RPC12/RpoP